MSQDPCHFLPSITVSPSINLSHLLPHIKNPYIFFLRLLSLLIEAFHVFLFVCSCSFWHQRTTKIRVFFGRCFFSPHQLKKYFSLFFIYQFVTDLQTLIFILRWCYIFLLILAPLLWPFAFSNGLQKYFLHKNYVVFKRLLRKKRNPLILKFGCCEGETKRDIYRWWWWWYHYK